MEIYINLVPNAIKMLFCFANQAASIEQDELIPKVHEFYEHYLKASGYMHELSEMLIRQEEPTFVLGNITIVDFHYMMSTHIFMGFFGWISTEVAGKNWHPQISAYQPKIEGLEYLKVNKLYLQAIKRQSFYLKHKEYLESFPELAASATEASVLGLKKLWATDL